MRPKGGDLAQKDTETSLIEQFLYPKFGPGQLWEHVADHVQPAGRRGPAPAGASIAAFDDATAPTASSPSKRRTQSGERRRFDADYFFSTMPVKELIRALDRRRVPATCGEVGDGLMYRDFITVGLLVDRLLVTEPDGAPLKDNWIYIQEPDVLVGRLQIFNNWSPYMVADPSKVWIGLEYFCYETDDLWKHAGRGDDRASPSRRWRRLASLRADDVRDGHVVRVPKTYPAYFGTYDRFDEIRDMARSVRESVPGRPQRHAQVQQPGPLHADRHDRGRQHPRRHHRQERRSGRSTPSRTITKKSSTKGSSITGYAVSRRA